MLGLILRSAARIGAVLFFMSRIMQTSSLAVAMLYTSSAVLVYYSLFADVSRTLKLVK